MTPTSERPRKQIPLMVLQEPVPARSPQPRGFVLWQLGFRAFYLLAGIFGTVSIALWAAQIRYWPVLWRPRLDGALG